jgi:hypothetical protein
MQTFLKCSVGIHHADYVALSIHKKLALILLTSGGRLVGIVRLWTQATESVLFLYGAHGSLVLKALGYKPGGLGFET